MNITLRPTTISVENQHVARRLRGKRLALGLSEARVAQTLGVGPELITAYERGLVPVPAVHLRQLGDIFDVPVSYFLPPAK
jgi:transcriptional regulator with XRE-family HTH domain